MCDVYGFERAEPVLESYEHKILWDFQIQTDHQLEYNQPDLVVLDRKARDCIILDVEYFFDTRIIHKDNVLRPVSEKISRHAIIHSPWLIETCDAFHTLTLSGIFQNMFKSLAT